MCKRVFALVVLLFVVGIACNRLLAADDKPAPIKIAVVDMEKVFRSYYKTKVSDGNLKKQAEVFKAYSEKLNNSLMKLQEEFKELRDASQNVALSEAERENKRLGAQDKYRQVKAKESELIQYNREKERQLRDDYEKMRSKLLAEIRDAVKKRSMLEGYTLVLDLSGKTLNNIPSVIHYSESIDLTATILKELNRGHEDLDTK